TRVTSLHDCAYPEGYAALVAPSRRRFGSGVDHSYFASNARGRRFDSCHAPKWGACSSVVERFTYCGRPFPARAVLILAVVEIIGYFIHRCELPKGMTVVACFPWFMTLEERRMRINTKRASLVTHEGARAQHISILARLRRSVLSCLLWESEFYEDGEEISKR